MKLLNKISTSSALLSLLVAQMSQGAFAQKVRFEKFDFDKGVDKKIGFPLSEYDATFLRENSNSDSVMLPAEGCSGVSFTELKKSLKKKGAYPPTYPEDKAFWGELREVAYAASERKKYEQNKKKGAPDPLPKVMKRITHLWNGKLDIVEVAEAVRAEFPGVYHRELITEWLTEDSLKRKSTLFQTNNPNTDFLRFEIMLSDMTGHAIRLVGPCDFSLKWDVGRPRPEEVAWKVKKNKLKVPVTKPKDDDDLLKLIRDIDFNSATEFTAYDEGSPNHPSYPAMHSAASAGSFWLDVLMDLNKYQLCEARMLDYSVSYARTVAGVHYASDNIAGLMVGQEILAQKLPQYLHDEYGADFTKVTEAVKAARFDWNDFENSECWNFKKYKTVAKGEPVPGKPKNKNKSKKDEL